MKTLNSLEYLKLSKPQAFWYNLKLFVISIPKGIANAFLKLWALITGFVLGIKDGVLDIVHTFTKGNWAVKLSFLIFGFGNIYYGQILRGVLFLAFEIFYLVYMFVLPQGGIYWLDKVNWFQKGITVGTEQGYYYKNPDTGRTTWISGDDSTFVLLWSLMAVILTVALIVTWRMQVKQCRICMDITSKGKKIKSGKEDLKSLLDDQFHKTLLTPSLLGILIFTVLPIIFMVLIAFTDYSGGADGYSKLFSWVGWDNFEQLFNFGNGGLGNAFSEILTWTLIWSFFATFSNYFLGMFVAIMINKKGIKLKKLWRTILVMTIAIPQFVSLLYVGNMFGRSGIIGSFLYENNLLPQAMLDQFQFTLWANPLAARILVIVINIWVGIPYVMLMATGILMNIPADLYESSRIDGANTVQQFMKITLPYMLFVTGPSLLTSFVGNLNNFNVIYLLVGGGPTNTEIGTAGGTSVGHTDLLITWLYNITLGGQNQYYMASVIGILVFVVVAVLSLVVYNIIPSTKNEEDYS